MMHEGLWDKLVTLEPDSVARKAKCEYTNEQNSYMVKLLSRDYIVDLDEKKILPADDQQEEVGFTEQLCILAYLINARELPIADKLVTVEKLEGGQFFFRGPHALPTDKLQDAFGKNPALLYEVSAHLNAKQCDFGDGAVEILALQRVPLTFVIWTSDEEFEARASILFDKTASSQLPLDALMATVELTVNEMLKKL